MTNASELIDRMLGAIDLPLALVEPSGALIQANRAMRALFVEESDLSEPTDVARLLGGAPDALETFLRSATMTSGVQLGSLETQADAGALRYQLRGSRLEMPQGVIVLLRVASPEANRFRLLTEQIEKLQAELRIRRRTEVLLEETVSEREMLLRELHHRVKNNMHMLAALLSGAAREARSPDARAALGDIHARVAALGTVQQLLYKSDLIQSVGSKDLLSPICTAAFAMVDHPVKYDLQCQDVQLPVHVATSLALILNELLTNSLKYGRPAAGTQNVVISLEEKDGLVRMTVHDNGPGFELTETQQRASGIGLVRGLLRQIGGRLEIDGSEGARSVATFRIRQNEET